MIINIQTPLINYKKFTLLPDAVKEFAINYNTILKIRSICSKYRLNEEQTIKTAYINGLVIIKEIAPSDFIADLQDTLKIDNQTAKNLANDLYQQIIKEAETLYIVKTGPMCTPQPLPTTPAAPLPITTQSIPRPQNTPVRSYTAPQITPYVQPPAAPQPKTSAPNNDRYLEPLDEPTLPPRPRIDGNVIDLKNQQ